MNWEGYLLYVTRAALVIILCSALFLYKRSRELGALERTRMVGTYLKISKPNEWYDVRIEKLLASIRFFGRLLLVGFVLYAGSLLATIFIPMEGA